jgi:small subunit ribosomal protein S17
MTETQSNTRNVVKRNTMIGTVVSDTMDKTISVVHTRKVKHLKYKKYIKRSHKVLAHDENNSAHVGDTVLLMECRPYSKRKSWRLIKVLNTSSESSSSEENEKTASED